MSIFTPRRGILAALALVAIALVADAYVAPAAHPVQSLGGTQFAAVAYASTRDLWWLESSPTGSLAQIRCAELTNDGRSLCTPDYIAARFPALKQSQHTLYYVWNGCLDSKGDAGPVIPWAGHNIEYFSSSRTLVLHCYVGTPWFYRPEFFAGLGPEGGFQILLAIPTAGIGAGSLQIREDDRLEHLIGDQSTEYELATATIS